ncbi:MAG: hypothetical protein EA398_05290 [Deltaproteobacteria bacterium]|nr:MAG: hypothetical protein EA398_05290 [Deltaproteobacteria bacterium]
MSTLVSEDLRKAVKLFNRWQFAEAAEAFEKLLPLHAGTDRALLDVLGLLSTGFNRIWHKGGEPNALVNYLEKGLEQLEPLGTNSWGIDTQALRDSVAQCIEEAMRWRRGDVDVYNRDLIPRLELHDPT